LLDDEDREVQEAAIQALGEIGGREAVRLLRRRLADADERVRAAVEAALEQAEFGDDPLGLTL
jgi:HEAT repeat protein